MDRTTGVAVRRLSATKAIMYGGLVVGTLDAADAVAFFGLRGASPSRVFQGIAAGLLGRAAFQDGVPAAALGLTIHFFIAFAIVAAYVMTSRILPALVRRPLAAGAAYGVAVYFFMNRVVIPLSAIGPPAFALPVFVNGIAIHIAGVGIPAALFAARCALAPSTRPTRGLAHLEG